MKNALEEEIARLEAELSTAPEADKPAEEASPAETPAPEADEAAGPAEEAPADGEQPAEPPKDEKPAEAAVETKAAEEEVPENPTAAAFIKKRREAREAAKLAAAKEQEANELKASLEAMKAEVERLKANKPAEGDEQPIDPTLQEIMTLRETVAALKQEAEERRAREVQDGAWQQLTQIGEQYAKTNPDFDDAVQQVMPTLTTAARFRHPDASQEQIVEIVKRDLLIQAHADYTSGLNPAEEFYARAIERFGYVPKADRKQEAAPAEEAKPAAKHAYQGKASVATIEANKRKSASPAAAGGNAARPVSLEDYDTMTNADFSKSMPELLKMLNNRSSY